MPMSKVTVTINLVGREIRCETGWTTRLVVKSNSLQGPSIEVLNNAIQHLQGLVMEGSWFRWRAAVVASVLSVRRLALLKRHRKTRQRDLLR